MYNDDIMDTVLGILLILFIFLAVTVLIVSVVQLSDRKDCETLSTDTGLNTRFDTTQGCLIEVSGEWIPEDKLVYLFPKFLEEQNGFPEREK